MSFLQHNSMQIACLLILSIILSAFAVGTSAQTRVVVIPLGGDDGGLPQARIVRPLEQSFDRIFRVGGMEYTNDPNGSPLSNFGRVCATDEQGAPLDNIQINRIARTACRELGYADGIGIVSTSSNGIFDGVNNDASDLPVAYSNLTCPEGSASLAQCSVSENVANCGSDDAIALRCLVGNGVDVVTVQLPTSLDRTLIESVPDTITTDDRGTNDTFRRIIHVDLGSFGANAFRDERGLFTLENSFDNIVDPAAIARADFSMQITIREVGATHTMIGEPVGNTNPANEYFRFTYPTVRLAEADSDDADVVAAIVNAEDFVVQFTDTFGRRWETREQFLRPRLDEDNQVIDDDEQVIVDAGYAFTFIEFTFVQ